MAGNSLCFPMMIMSQSKLQLPSSFILHLASQMRQRSAFVCRVATSRVILTLPNIPSPQTRLTLNTSLFWTNTNTHTHTHTVGAYPCEQVYDSASARPITSLTETVLKTRYIQTHTQMRAHTQFQPFSWLVLLQPSVCLGCVYLMVVTHLFGDTWKKQSCANKHILVLMTLFFPLTYPLCMYLFLFYW